MFDDLEPKSANNQPAGGGSAVPPRVPGQEPVPQSPPQDIFADIELLRPGGDGIRPEKPPIFQAKAPTGESGSGSEIRPQSHVHNKKMLVAGLILIGISLFAAGSWYVYGKIFSGDTAEQPGATADIPAQTNVNPAGIGAENQASPINKPVANPEVTADNNQASADETEDPAGIGEQAATGDDPAADQDDVIDKELLNADQDNDSLTDQEERELGTDPNKADTDDDGLFDREEVKVYKTNPLDRDTDKDGYMDGAEVKNGYNPNGEGKLFDLNQ